MAEKAQNEAVKAIDRANEDMNRIFHGTTKSGFEFNIPVKRFYNMLLLEELKKANDGDFYAVSNILTMLLGEDEKKRLYEYCVDPDGIVTTDAVSRELTDIFDLFNNAPETAAESKN